MTPKPTSPILLKHEDATGTAESGSRSGRDDPKTKELAATTMTSGQDLDGYFKKAIIKRREVEAMDKSKNDRRCKNILAPRV